MLANKIILTFCVILLTSTVGKTTATECIDCRGTKLIQDMKQWLEMRNCWFKPENHYQLGFKAGVISGVAGALDNLYRSTNEKASEECRKDLNLQCSNDGDLDAYTKCLVTNMDTTAKAYQEIEQCVGKISDPTDMDRLFRVMLGSIVGWHVVHPDC
ncbi:uncharacterized protein LOC142230696 [Haematobia irritans]|uniref:uncharacterized protein LOC142230696 n=1 Tax=Haematobia irritans TaxID=7368 RepID=UPI003F501522